MEYIQLCGYIPSNPCPSPDPYVGQGALSEALKQRHHKKIGTKDIILTMAGVLLVVLLTVFCILVFCLNRKRKKTLNAEGGQEKESLLSQEKLKWMVTPEAKWFIFIDHWLLQLTTSCVRATTEIMGMIPIEQCIKQH